ncbi:RimK family protein [Alteromonas sp. CYL-A6]|uniref:RimK family protein n=1 Tax=Alteromonas nitratireducens TaxID=3390813 RepID=UPI0034A908B3
MHNTLIVADDPSLFSGTDLTVLTFADYLADFPKRNEPKTRVINLCDTSRYLSEGYYCSLLAQARNHLVLPSVNTINDLRTDDGSHRGRLPLPSGVLQDGDVENGATCLVMFGEPSQPAMKKVARKAFESFRCPILRVVLHIASDVTPVNAKSVSQPLGHIECEPLGFAELNGDEQQQCIAALKQYMHKQWRASRKGKKMRWDMAILVNPDEPTPPSDDKALRQFVKAAAKVGFQADVVSRLSPEELGHYDALFIRETTAIDHHTYRLARAAEREGIVVMDDTQSILRCCNKVYLQDAFAYQQVPAPKAKFVSQADDAACDALIEELGLPIVLKLPESSFSRGVHKAKDKQELKSRLEEMLASSALVLVQEYIPTDFDWRIGMLAGKPIYACKYFMARNHWQIYHHEGDRFSSGGFATMPTFEVPKPVLNAAIKAAKTVGDGLYGVDIKQTGNKVYVIEVNDNPSIDSGIEDKYLGNTLYELIMQEFADRLEQRGR